METMRVHALEDSRARNRHRVPLIRPTLVWYKLADLIYYGLRFFFGSSGRSPVVIHVAWIAGLSLRNRPT